MRFLIVVHEYTPLRSPRAYRWGAIAEQLVREGHHVDVVCSWKPGLARRQSETVNVTRVGDRWTAALRQKLARPAASSQHGLRQEGPALPRRPAILSRVAAWAYYKLWKPLYWPDAQCMFMAPALRAAGRLLQSHRYDALITVSLPFCCHLVGLALKRRHPDLPWIVDIGDPFALLHETPLNNHRLYGRLNHYVEAVVLRAADHVAVTTGGALHVYRRQFDCDSEKIRVIPPLQSLPQGASLPTVSARGVAPRDVVRLVYCGRLYSDIRSPAYLLKVMRGLIDTNSGGRPLELHFYGDTRDCREVFAPYQDWIGTHLFLHGEVDRTVVAAALAEADLMVNIGNSTSHQLPSKVVEYIGMGKPILNLVSHGQDCSLELLADHPATLNLQCHVDSLEVNVARVAQLLSRLPIVIEAEKLTALQAPFLPQTIAAAYVRLVHDGARSTVAASAHSAEARRAA